MDKIAALKKIAYDEDNDTAGIGTWRQNSLEKAYPAGGKDEFVTPSIGKDSKPVDASSYYAQLLSNAKKDSRGSTEAFGALNGVAPRLYPGEPWQDSDIKNPDLAELRERQADSAARWYFGGLDGVRQYLTERGEANQRAFNKSKTVPYSPVDLPRLMQLLNGKKLTPKQMQILPAIQNSMSKTEAPSRARRATRA